MQSAFIPLCVPPYQSFIGIFHCDVIANLLPLPFSLAREGREHVLVNIRVI